MDFGSESDEGFIASNSLKALVSSSFNCMYMLIKTSTKLIRKGILQPHSRKSSSVVNELTDINFSEIEVTKLPHAPKGKKIKDVEVIISLQKN